MTAEQKIFVKEKIDKGSVAISRYKIFGMTFFRKEIHKTSVIYYCFGMKFSSLRRAAIKTIWHFGRYQKVIKTFLQVHAQDKKIVLFSHEFSVTGAPLALYKAALILQDKGYKIFLVAPKGGNLEKFFIDKNLNYLVIPNILRAKAKVYAKLFNGFDGAICNTYVSAYAARCLQQVLPTLLYIHEAREGLFSFEGEKENQVCRLPITQVLGEVKNVACVSEFAASFYQPYVKNKIEIIKNFVDDATQPVYVNTSGILKIGYVGTIDNVRKKTDLLCECFAELSEKFENVELHILGSVAGNYAQELKEQYHHRVVWHGEIVGQEKDKTFNSMDIVVVPSLLESCSLVALEAAAYSKPLVITENVGAKYMFEPGVSAMICKVNDKASLKACLEQLINDKNLRLKLAKNARQAYEKYATRDNTAKELLDVLHKVMADFGK